MHRPRSGDPEGGGAMQEMSGGGKGKGDGGGYGNGKGDGDS